MQKIETRSLLSQYETPEKKTNVRASGRYLFPIDTISKPHKNEPINEYALFYPRQTMR
jgi:hypothetical protein